MFRRLALCLLTICMFMGVAKADEIGWRDPVSLVPGSLGGYSPEVSADGGLLTVTWVDYALYNQIGDKNTEIYAVTSTDQGETWSAPALLSNNTRTDYWLDVENSSTSSVATWIEGIDDPSPDVLHISRYANGTWASVTAPSSMSYANNTELAEAGGTYYLMVQQGAEWTVSRSVDDGLTWSAPTKRMIGGSSYESVADIAAPDPSTLIATWLDKRDGRSLPEVYVSRSTDGGLTWATDTRLTNSELLERPPSVVVNGSRVVTAWVTRTAENSSRLEVSASSDGGVTWGPVTVVSELGFQANGYLSFEFGQPMLAATDSGFELYTGSTSDPVRRFVSADGLSWSEGSAPEKQGVDFRGVAAAGSYRHLVGHQGSGEAGNPVYVMGGLGIEQPTISGLVARPSRFSPNGDGVKDKTKILFGLNVASRVSVRISKTSSGSGTVRTLMSDVQKSPGSHRVIWNGKDDGGRVVKPDKYWIQVTARNDDGEVVETAGVVVIK